MTYPRVKDPKAFSSASRPISVRARITGRTSNSRRMHELVETIPGFISIKGFTGEVGEEIDIVRFESEEALEAWRNQPEHRTVQDLGWTVFYDYYHVEACRVFREYEFILGSTEPASGLHAAIRPNPDGAGSTPPSGRG